MHAETLYHAGGWRAALQRALTHQVPVEVFVVAEWALVVALVVALALRHRRWLAGAAVLVGGWLVFGLLGVGENGGTPERPNILLVANDSMRPDRLGAYGYERPTSPNLDRLAAESVVFEHAYVPLARTFPSWASMLTGLWPHEHGIRHMFPPPDQRLGDQPTLPRLLAEAGYRTAVVADYAGDIFTRLDAGFESVRAPAFNFRSLVRQRCLQMLPAILPWLENPLGRALFPDAVGLVEYPQTATTMDALLDEIDAGDERPFAIVAFFSTSHFPYASPDPEYRRFTDPAYDGANLYLRFRTPYEDPEALARESGHLGDLFDGTVHHFDAQLARLLAHLERRGLDDRTVLVVTADHGEDLGELGTSGHGDHLRGRWSLQVPLLLRGPGLGPRRVPGLVRTLDLPRTLATLAGVPSGALGGEELGPLLRGERTDLGLLGFAETGVWFTASGEAFYFADRLTYPDLTSLAEVRADHGHEVCMRPDYEDVVRVAKHRAVWDRERKVIYVPTPDGPRYEGWRLVDGREVEAPVDPKLRAALDEFLRAGGRNALVGGYALPKSPTSPP